MKHRSTTPVSNTLTAKATLVAVSILMAGAGIFHVGSVVLARDYDAEIRAKQEEADTLNAEASRLEQMAGTLQEELNNLNSQINTLQEQINASQKKYDDLVAEIARQEQLIEQNRKTLGIILSDIYVDDQITPLEMLASSNSLGDYIDKQEQRTDLRSALSDKIKEIKALQEKLESDRAEVENILKDQQSQKSMLASKQAEQAKLVNDTKDDQNAYASLANQRNGEIAKLREQQAAENLRQLQQSGWTGSGIPAPSSGNGGYPAVWANAPLDAFIDNWGLYTRECVSYVAWKIYSTGRFVPHFGGRGNANQWPTTTSGMYSPTLGGTIQQGSTPRVGAAAVTYGGPYGHVMYVEAVHDNGTITVSDYNLGVDGLYRYYNRSASGITYIYF